MYLFIHLSTYLSLYVIHLFIFGIFTVCLSINLVIYLFYLVYSFYSLHTHLFGQYVSSLRGRRDVTDLRT